jgi:RimJ/RimL family protein N-acetyltransferase
VQTARLVMEPLGHEHAEGLVEALADPRVNVYLPVPDVTTVEALHARLDRLASGPAPGIEWVNFAVRRREDGVVLGRLEATLHGHYAEIAYVFGPAFWGHGYAREGVAWLMAHLRGLGVVELWACVVPGNARSTALLAHLGFVTAEPPASGLGSYDVGDLVFVHR